MNDGNVNSLWEIMSYKLSLNVLQIHRLRFTAFAKNILSQEISAKLVHNKATVKLILWGKFCWLNEQMFNFQRQCLKNAAFLRNSSDLREQIS